MGQMWPDEMVNATKTVCEWTWTNEGLHQMMLEEFGAMMVECQRWAEKAAAEEGGS